MDNHLRCLDNGCQVILKQIRSELKVAVLDQGNCPYKTNLYPFSPHHERILAIATLAKLACQFNIQSIIICNGAASSETIELVDELIHTFPALTINKIVVNATGDKITNISDLKKEMLIEGIVTHVAEFGAFVDIGLAHPGLVHISELSHQFVNDPGKMIKIGQIVNVKIINVEPDRKRITLSIKQASPSKPTKPLANTAMADALKKLNINLKDNKS